MDLRTGERLLTRLLGPALSAIPLSSIRPPHLCA
ncbi:hypothetical protein SAMN05216209_4207 [Pseudomonas nitroreducens]|nr:hypothetical protein SAMN05216209_4207 [Pseudomonas nitroreducens]